MHNTVENSLYVLNSVLGQTPLKDWVQSITYATPSYASPMPGGDFVAFMFLVNRPAPNMSEDTVLELISTSVFVYPGPDSESSCVVLAVPLEVLMDSLNGTDTLPYRNVLGIDLLCKN